MTAEENKSSLFNLIELKQLGGFKAGDLLAVDPKLYEKFMMHLSRTVKRDVAAKNMVFLTGASAYTPEPNNLFLRGESSIGKSYNVVQALKYFPRDDVWLLGGLSPTALIHQHGILVDKNGEVILPSDKPDKEASAEEKEAWRQRLKDSRYLVELHGKILVFLEAPPFETFNMLRPILSHDAPEISYRFTDKTGKGQLQTQHVVIRGWPATIFCSTQEKYVQDLATRGFTVTPETTQKKYRDANILTGSKAAFPWKFEHDFDFMLLESYVRFLKHHLEDVKIAVPYAKEFAEKFPSRFPRSMRDFKHILNLIKVSALFHLFQRPVLTRKIKVEVEGKNPTAPEYKEVEAHYIMAVRQDYDFIMGLWNEIRETTETSAPGHIIKFYHEVVEPLAKQNVDFTVEDLVGAWNSRFEDKKSSDTIRKWVDFLCDIGYLTKKPDPNDKRRNHLETIATEKNRNYTQINFSEFFTVDLFKAWLNEANQILEKNQISLRESLISDGEVSVDEVFNRFFLNKNVNSSNICLSNSEASLNEKSMEKTESDKIVQFPNFSATDVRGLVRLTMLFEDKCSICKKYGRMDWQVTLHDNTWGLLCGDCGLKLEKELTKIE